MEVAENPIQKNSNKIKNNGILSAVDGNNGYYLEMKLSEEELTLLRKMIRIQWLYRIQLLVPYAVSHFDALGMEQYHKAAHLIKHSRAWPKTSRVLPREAVVVIRQMAFFKKIIEEIGEIEISDEENLGWENVYWRLVRPGNEDVGALHADKWFWDLGNYGKVADYPHRRLKMWQVKMDY